MSQAAERPYPKLTPEQKARVLAELLQEYHPRLSVRRIPGCVNRLIPMPTSWRDTSPGDSGKERSGCLVVAHGGPVPALVSVYESFWYHASILDNRTRYHNTGNNTPQHP